MLAMMTMTTQAVLSRGSGMVEQVSARVVAAFVGRRGVAVRMRTATRKAKQQQHQARAMSSSLSSSLRTRTSQTLPTQSTTTAPTTAVTTARVEQCSCHRVQWQQQRRPMAALVKAMGKGSWKEEADRHLALNQQQLIQALTSDSRMLTVTEGRQQFPVFAQLLSTAMHARMLGVWQDLKCMYNPLDPDKDIKSLPRATTAKDALHDYQRFMSLFSKIVDNANFDRLPTTRLAAEVQQKVTAEGVKVSADPSAFRDIRVWTRGTTYAAERTWHRRATTLLQRLRGQPTEGPKHVYQRVLLTYRDPTNALHVKLFKDIEDDRLELLLPNIRIEMSDFDKYFLYSSVAMVGMTSAYRLFSNSALTMGVLSKSLAVVLAAAGVALLQYWTGLRNNRNAYTAKHTQLLYTNNISDNRSALALLVDRATEEEYAELLLAYFFLVTTPGPLSAKGLSILVEEWLLETFRARATFDVEDALKKLEEFGLLKDRWYDRQLRCDVVTAQPLKRALTQLQEMPLQGVAGLQQGYKLQTMAN
ncbi:hypothetical protein PTSG_07141 [Salpingoeca rosetta]|uniref:Transmembrane protein 143 n=1 Tax=Salpingoeca rosetta (strain ATCC 50818 / BSB-021) TaxID=946362 RepID=F2UE63_SALR5|nr:uncharacterized protein PTSG_07141 [Salpingoeca rosetta]EGD74913.1 hypothetical protein PTSG_07141 [Salpingoeca rosetta]|eukprot:XP_004992558.1 hypothetical protein PTSG_07141 [Salpingoeca rosetta]